MCVVETQAALGLQSGESSSLASGNKNVETKKITTICSKHEGVCWNYFWTGRLGCTKFKVYVLNY